MHQLLPTQKLPEISVNLVGGSTWKLSENAPEFMLMIDVYRGLHCPRCGRHLEEVSAAREEFRAVGLEVIALSTDPVDRAEKFQDEWNIPNIPLGYGLSIETAKKLGLFISQPYRDGEPELFAEPGIFFVLPDTSLYGVVLNSFPFARPSASSLVEVAKVVRERNYPPRGTIAS